MTIPLRAFAPDQPSFPDGTMPVAELVQTYLDDMAARVASGYHSKKSHDDTRRNLLRFAARFDKNTSACRQNDFTVWLNENPQWESVGMKKRVTGDVVTCFV